MLKRNASPVPFAVIPAQTGKPANFATWMRIDTISGVLEIGHVNRSLLMQWTTASTEAIFLLLQYAFDKWEFRQAAVTKDRNRGAILSRLNASNFDSSGKQIR